jgi:hypothetical protein
VRWRLCSCNKSLTEHFRQTNLANESRVSSVKAMNGLGLIVALMKSLSSFAYLVGEWEESQKPHP